MKTYTIEEAAADLPKLAREAYDEEPVVLVDGTHMLILSPYAPPPELSPSLLYSDEEIALENKMAEASFRCIGMDLES